MYNGPSGPRILLTMRVSSACTAVAANIAPTAKQKTLLTLILIPLVNTECQFRRRNCRSSSFPQRPFYTRVLPNLMRDVEQRDHHRKSADDLSEVGEVAEIHWFQLEPGGRLRSIAPTYVDSETELRFDTVRIP